MTLMADALGFATRKINEQNGQLASEQQASGNRIAEWFSKSFGYEATYISHGSDESFKRERDLYGNYSWHKHTDYRYRIIVDGTTLGVRLKHNESVPEIEVVYLACGHCSKPSSFPLPHISLYGKTIKESQERLLECLGRVAIKGTICSRCEAEPCNECGRPL